MNYKKIAERFCATRLPQTVCADTCASDPAYKYHRSGTNLLTVAEAEKVMADVLGATPYLEILQLAWHQTASLISFHHADDSGKEWGKANALKPLLKELETQIKAYGGEQPKGEYLLGADCRIAWSA
ncbi:MAG: hypothetical protein ACOVQ0_16395 [Novosphingobium sp.]|uniref:hypothetical protein n=1 Tax=Novosphingobium sp. TaxID=1874826 RepID=UPI003B9DB0FA